MAWCAKKPVRSLNDIFIRSIKPPEKGQVSYPDGTLPGLALRVSQGCTKTFVLVHGRSRTRTTIGRYPIISLAQARQKAREILAEITLGTHKPKSITFQDAFDLYRQHKLPQNREATRKETERLLGRPLSRFGRGSLAELQPQEIAAFLDGLSKTPAEANNCFVALRTFANWCCDRGYTEVPFTGRLKKSHPSKPRDRTLSPTELRDVLLASDTRDRYAQLIRFLIYTGQRYGQATALTPNHIGQDQTLHWPREQMKTGRSHSVPFSFLTAALLKESLIPFTKNDKPHANLVKTAGVEHFTRHDIRRGFATLHAQLGTPQHITERLLAHATPGGSAIHLVYNRFEFLDAQRQACEAYERFLSDLIASA
jgi:integrase